MSLKGGSTPDLKAERLGVEVSRPQTPTLLVAGLIYGGWLALTLFHGKIPLPLAVLAGG